MKLPKYFIETMQQASDVGINPFALQLLAESFGDKPERFGDENVVFLAHAHNGQQVWFVMSKTQPTAEDFIDVANLHHALEESVKLQAHYADLLNMHDGGKRIVFENAAAWLARLAAVRAETRERKAKR